MIELDADHAGGYERRILVARAIPWGRRNHSARVLAIPERHRVRVRLDEPIPSRLSSIVRRDLVEHRFVELEAVRAIGGRAREAEIAHQLARSRGHRLRAARAATTWERAGCAARPRPDAIEPARQREQARPTRARGQALPRARLVAANAARATASRRCERGRERIAAGQRGRDRERGAGRRAGRARGSVRIARSTTGSRSRWHVAGLTGVGLLARAHHVVKLRWPRTRACR